MPVHRSPLRSTKSFADQQIRDATQADTDLSEIIVLSFLAATGLVVWATCTAIAGGTPTWSRVMYLLALTGSAIAAFFTTFRYTYLSNPNTCLHGWPVPIVIFQRDGPGKPWLDFVGPTVILAYPMNLVLFAFIPALVLLAVYYFHNRSEKPSPDMTTAPEDHPQTTE